LNTIQDYLDSQSVDIRPLLEWALNKTSAELFINNHYKLNTNEKKTLKRLTQQRKKGVPFAYLTGQKGFYHLNFKVTSDTLIPRPETELLIEIAHHLKLSANPKVLDLGTGSGIIAITLADKNPNWLISAVDNSKPALEIAKQNTTQQINFKQGYWFEPFNKEKFDLIISNPPYLEADDVHLKELKFEPKSALVSGKDGLEDLSHIIQNAPNYLEKKGYLLLEHGFNQQAEVVKLLNKNFSNIQTFKDYNANNRAVLAQIKTC
jgi:release factor glutamine methyltransferase